MLRLKRERVLAELSQNALAQAAGIHPNTVSGTECGRLRPYPRQLEAMAEALGWPVDRAVELLDEVEDEAAQR